ncbi:adenine deaminase [Pullulanibacillus sp. KACC 23026]|uniref:adenine deaminase n=1 Tax=Pullulanibacillus sp. KACC 23026 TaxID=3028315 RepID=UPI0023B00C90|nr:adenine deaminase [Pullulanibacillus sp. KACC 23026]WEG12187.1 adenine deaminase [Pullulanibacillus sp. KACC 23026]
MLITKEHLQKRIAVASKQIPADIVIKNGIIIDVFNLEFLQADLAICDGFFVGIGEFEGNQIIDAKGRYISPALIDGHVHIESSMITPSEFAKVVLPHGVTTVVTDPHEIANVSGVEGLEFMLNNSEGSPLDVYVMLPSCVPATPFEHNGAVLTSRELEPFYSHPRVLGLAEVMDYPSLRMADDRMLDKVEMTLQRGGHIDGHLAGLDSTAVNVYKASGITTDHESHTIEEGKSRLARGMYLLIREGSVAKDLTSLIDLVTLKNARRCVFCTDDKHLDDLIEEGSINHIVRLAIQCGLDPLLAIQMATLNPAECYGLSHKGALAPGYQADFLLIDDLENMSIAEVYKSGQCVAKNGVYLEKPEASVTSESKVSRSIVLPKLTSESLQLPLTSSQANVIGIIPNQITTNKLVEEVNRDHGLFVPSLESDQLKMVVIERHHQTGNIGLGIVKGFGLKAGAIATTIAHDSHNIVATGTNDADLHIAIEAVADCHGGLVIVKDQKVIASLSLSIGGLMSDQSYKQVYDGLLQIKPALLKLGFVGDFNPFLTLSFLTLPVIPSLKLTDMGLFDVQTMSHIPVSV